jgi:hypothetical protein
MATQSPEPRTDHRVIFNQQYFDRVHKSTWLTIAQDRAGRPDKEADSLVAKLRFRWFPIESGAHLTPQFGGAVFCSSQKSLIALTITSSLPASEGFTR